MSGHRLLGLLDTVFGDKGSVAESVYYYCVKRCVLLFYGAYFSTCVTILRGFICILY